MLGHGQRECTFNLNFLNTVFESHVTMVPKFTEERQTVLSEMSAGAAMPEPNLLISCWDEVNLFIAFERLPKITYLSVSRVCSWHIMDGGGGNRLVQGKLQMQLIDSAGHENIKRRCSRSISLPLIHQI